MVAYQGLGGLGIVQWVGRDGETGKDDEGDCRDSINHAGKVSLVWWRERW